MSAERGGNDEFGKVEKEMRWAAERPPSAPVNFIEV